jgi:8-oxo-dGTP pyrophosphatase MutT (NUDIX family)
MARPPEVDALAAALQVRARRNLTIPPGAPQAAVLALLCNVQGQVHVLFTLRTQTVPTHKGQVAFPGGGREPEDPDLTATALREAEEEIGLPPSAVEVLGLSDDVFSIHGLRVTPVVGWVGVLPPLEPSPREIADVFTVPLEALRRPDAVTEQEWHHPDGTPRMVPFYAGGRHQIWGLTAWMLRDLLRVLDNATGTA